MGVAGITGRLEETGILLKLTKKVDDGLLAEDLLKQTLIEDRLDKRKVCMFDVGILSVEMTISVLEVLDIQSFRMRLFECGRTRISTSFLRRYGGLETLDQK